jgi:hypothetical protein
VPSTTELKILRLVLLFHHSNRYSTSHLSQRIYKLPYRNSFRTRHSEPVRWLLSPQSRTVSLCDEFTGISSPSLRICETHVHFVHLVDREIWAVHPWSGNREQKCSLAILGERHYRARQRCVQQLRTEWCSDVYALHVCNRTPHGIVPATSIRAWEVKRLDMPGSTQRVEEQAFSSEPLVVSLHLNWRTRCSL